MLKIQPRDFEISLETKRKWTIRDTCHDCRETCDGGSSFAAAKVLPITQAPTIAEPGESKALGTRPRQSDQNSRGRQGGNFRTLSASPAGGCAEDASPAATKSQLHRRKRSHSQRQGQQPLKLGHVALAELTLIVAGGGRMAPALVGGMDFKRV